MGITFVMFSYCDFDVNHLVVVFKDFMCVLGQCLTFGFISLIQLNTFI